MRRRCLFLPPPLACCHHRLSQMPLTRMLMLTCALATHTLPLACAGSSAERTALQKEYDEFKITAAASRERMYSQLVSSIDMLTLHKENVEAQLAGLRKHCTGKIDSLFTSLNETAVELA